MTLRGRAEEPPTGSAPSCTQAVGLCPADEEEEQEEEDRSSSRTSGPPGEPQGPQSRRSCDSQSSSPVLGQEDIVSHSERRPVPSDTHFLSVALQHNHDVATQHNSIKVHQSFSLVACVLLACYCSTLNQPQGALTGPADASDHVTSPPQ